MKSKKRWIIIVLVLAVVSVISTSMILNHRETQQAEGFVQAEKHRASRMNVYARDLHLVVTVEITYSAEKTYMIEPFRFFSEEVRSILRSNWVHGERLVSVSYEIEPTEETFLLLEDINLAINSFLQKEWMIESEEGIVFLSEFTGNQENSIFPGVFYPLSVEDVTEDKLDVLWRLEGNPMIRREIDALRGAE